MISTTIQNHLSTRQNGIIYFYHGTIIPSRQETPNTIRSAKTDKISLYGSGFYVETFRLHSISFIRQRNISYYYSKSMT